MKSVYFKRKESVIRVMNEEARRKKFNWDRLIYFLVLCSLVIFGGFYIIKKTLYIQADGHVLFESVNIRLTDDARILEFRKKAGDSIKEGDTLFIYNRDPDLVAMGISGAKSGGNYAGNYSSEENSDWIAKEKYNLEKKIALNNVEITQRQSLADDYKKELKRLQNEVVLDVLPKNRLEIVQTEIIRLNAEIERIRMENKQLAGLISSLSGMDAGGKKVKTASFSGKNNGFGIGGNQTVLPFKSPIAGIITRVYLQDYEVALKSENILSIHQANNIFVKGYFNQEDLQYFKEGDILTLMFPDGTESKGILKHFYFATYPLPEEFQKKYEPVTRSISCDIYPLEGAELPKWKKFYKMSVKISKFKF